jgi:hypothetical protein
MATEQRQRERKKTWTRFGEMKRRPNDYEIVTHNMNHTMGATPLEMGPEVHGNLWLKRHRDSIALKASDWDAFRDPDRVTYDSYVRSQDDAETFIDTLLESYTANETTDAGLSSEALSLLGRVLTPQRYLVHAQMMLTAYIQQLAPSSYIGNCAVFQAADQLRRVQRIAYRTMQLHSEHPVSGFGSAERGIWEKDANWQPMRKALERMLLVFDWDKAFVANNLVVRPVLDALFLSELSAAMRRLGDELDALILENLFRDSQRHDRWTVALTKFLVAEDGNHRTTLREFAGEWTEPVEEIIEAGARLVAAPGAALKPSEVAERVRDVVALLQSRAGLGHDA